MRRRTKIVATLGPASSEPGILAEMLRAGVDVVRINLSHGTAAEHRHRLDLARQAAVELGYSHVATLFDTRGPEIRVGDLGEAGLMLADGETVAVFPAGAAGPGTAGTARGIEKFIPVQYAGITKTVQPDDLILLDDGNLTLQVLAVTDKHVVCRVVAGGLLLSRKKVSLTRVPSDLPPLPDEDIEDIRLGVELGIDFVAASFIRNAEDVIAVRRVIEQFGGDQSIVAKIENPAAVENIEGILEVADAVMVARGDLGVQLPPEEVPIVQKQIIAACNRLGKPVITATQMLESMISHPRPTRAEASDVANAILDGTDAVMLSAETAIGSYPVEAVRVMARIAMRAEAALDHESWLSRSRQRRYPTVTDAISFASCTTAQSLGAAAILTATQSGHTARMVSRHRPKAPIVAATPSERVARKLSIVWGVIPVVVTATQGTDEMIEATVAAAQAAGVVQPGSLVVVTAGIPVGVPGTTNLLQVFPVGEPLGTGSGVGRGSYTGSARVARTPKELQDFNNGDILVVPAVTPEWMPFVEKCGALVVEEGGLSSPAAVAAINFGIPAVVGVPGATGKIPSGAVITVDGKTGMIYLGSVDLR